MQSFSRHIHYAHTVGAMDQAFDFNMIWHIHRSDKRDIEGYRTMDVRDVRGVGSSIRVPGGDDLLTLIP